MNANRGSKVMGLSEAPEQTSPLPVSAGTLLRDLVRTFIFMTFRVLYWRAYRRQWPRFHVRSFWRSIYFLFDRSLSLSVLTRFALVERFVRISQIVDCAHTNDEMLEVSSAILRLSRSVPGVVVEAGAFKGG